jgi:DNA-binding XRE family transcriptional regulator
VDLQEGWTGREAYSFVYEPFSFGPHRGILHTLNSLPLWSWPFWFGSLRIGCVEHSLQRFGANVRQARLDHGWTQEDLAHETGLATVQVSRIERGVREIRLTTLIRLLDGLDVPADKLLDGLLAH